MPVSTRRKSEQTILTSANDTKNKTSAKRKVVETDEISAKEPSTKKQKKTTKITNPDALKYHPKSREEWEQWLKDNHKKETEVWLVYYKKNAKCDPKEIFPYNDRVEPALCYGWIDSTARGIDNEKASLRFTPRKDSSNWSLPNKKRVKSLMARGLMTEAGFARMTDQVRKEIEELKECE
ncbi:MICOS complex subunit MIC60 [Acrasis kona]|uniref:MICOS complex subunit MIC60 n=1 Tax=Acrasis kona TaxID=1008807 RepID=A0AAW2ZIZ8_9EUKA